MNIVHILTFLDSQTGGMERQALQLAQHLRLKGHSLFFITCAHTATMRRLHFSFSGTLDGFRVYRIPFIRGWRRLNAFLYGVGVILLLVLLRRRYTIMHAHQLHTSGFIACVAKLLLPAKKLIVKNCCGGAWGDVQYLGSLYYARFMIALLQKYVDICIGVSDETVQEMHNIGLNKCIFIPNSVDTALFTPIQAYEKTALRKKLLPSFTHTAPLLLFVGRLTAQKDLPTLIDAIAFIPRAMLLVVGDGILRSALEVSVREKYLHDRIVFHGTTDRVSSFYQIADIFVLPSRAEGMPNTLLEAMSCGLPSIVADISSTRSMIRHDYDGYLFPVGDSTALARLITTILSDSSIAERIGEHARSSIQARCSVDTIVDAYVNLYTALI